MIKSNLVRILRTCSRKELRDLRKWLLSPAHNQREDVLRLFDYLLEDDHLYKDDFLSKQNLFRWVHPKIAFDDAKLRQTVFFFMKSLEEFFIYQEITQDEIRAKTLLARVYRKKKLDKTFQKNMRVVEQIQEKQQYRNGQYWQNEYFRQQELYAYLSDFKRTKLNLQEISDTLDVTYLADKLRQSCLILAHQTVYKTDYEIGMLDEVLTYVEDKSFLDIPAIAIYYYGYKATIDKEEPRYFQNLKKQIFAHDYLFPLPEIRDIYLMAINYCIGRMNAGHETFIREAFELYRKGFEQKILIENNKVSPWTFLNVIFIGLKLKEFEWVESYIHDNQKYLEDKHRETFVHYSLAQLHYDRGEFDKARRYLIQFDTDEIIVNLRAKNLLLKLYYEEEEFDALESLLESMRSYLLRKKVMGYHKSNFKNIIRLTRKLIKINPYNQNHRKKIKQEVEVANPLTTEDRKWLLRQIEQLK
ncbi:MAG: hypothetical protein AAGG75_08235 [Bacteroidota bacterium]